MVASLSGGIPMPLSETENRSRTPASSRLSTATSTRMKPALVNFSALPTRLRRIWRRRTGSPSKAPGTSAATRHSNSSPFQRAVSASRATARSTVSRNRKRLESRLNLPASILARSRISLMIVSRASADCCTMPR